MRFASKIVGLLLIVTLAAATFTTAALANVVRQASSPDRSSSAEPSEPAACHDHDGMTHSHNSQSHSPMPAPTSYQCCLTGHDAEMVRPQQFAQPSATVSPLAACVESVMTVSRLDGSEASEAPVADPPNITPLRI